jgi:predicted acylesterase/phospholipase RssA
MIIALAGRRIDDRYSAGVSFPHSQIAAVQQKLRDCFQRNKLTHLVCSAACGSDLLAVQEAITLPGVTHITLILPFDKETFLRVSVIDRGVEWGDLFHKVIRDKRVSVQELQVHHGGADVFIETNIHIVSEAKKTGGDVKCVVVWDGKEKKGSDYSALFRAEAARADLPVEAILIEYNPKKELIDRARNVLDESDVHREIDAANLSSLYTELERFDQFAYAAEVLLLKMTLDKQPIDPALNLLQQQRLVKYIYKDHSLPSAYKFSAAFDRLRKICDLGSTEHCELLGMAGALFKRKWQYDHLSKNLEISRHYYKRGYEIWMKYLGKSNGEFAHCNDNGWTAINYAFVCELMAVDRLEETIDEIGFSDSILNLLEEAVLARSEVLKQLKVTGEFPDSNAKTSGWILATIAEAHFALAEYDDAKIYIGKFLHAAAEGRSLDDIDESVLNWKVRSFAEQICSIASLQLQMMNASAGKNTAGSRYLSDIAPKINRARAEECLFLIANPRSLITRELQSRESKLMMGKCGLALSGGGFRASLYHIGVLAALAEHGMLRNLEVISCVSGGSIVGAYYYLKLKLLLETKPDAQITDQDYIDLIKVVEKEFVAAVQKNIRMHVFLDPWRNLMMAFSKSYSRTHRLGELYQDKLYDQVIQKSGSPAKVMQDLLIHPYGDDSFSISTDNWKRANKIPQLVLNATALNTGHNFQFTASWMGEPPGYIQPDIDVKPRLRRMYYEDAPAPYRNFSLGYAVAASSCVPVLFEPLPMYDLYLNPEGKAVKLQLIDGGLHDNQGIASLLEQECKNLIISDASGQMGTTIVDTGDPLSLFFRANTIIQERVREIQFMDVKERRNTAQIEELATLHLKTGLHQRPWSWVNCHDPIRKIFDSEDSITTPSTGILPEAQKLIAGIRTDLDAFHDVEAYSIMYCGYAQANAKISVKVKVRTAEWRFLQVEEYLKSEKKFAEIRRLLNVASKVPFKVFSVSYAAISLAVIALLAGVFFGVQYIRAEWGTPVRFEFTVGYILLALLLFIMGFVSEKLLILFNLRNVVIKKIILAGMVLFGFFVCGGYLLIFNNLYKKAGKLDLGDSFKRKSA